jgi:hypothetical protein
MTAASKSPLNMAVPQQDPAAAAGLAREARGQRPWLVLLLLALLLIPALLPLARSGFYVSDDGRFHVYRIAALANAWHQGVLYPRLFPEFGFDYGQAVLNYYAPLSYFPGAAAALVVGPAAAAELLVALGFILAALAAYGYGRYLWGPVAGLLAAVVYTYTPYHLADAYLRGAIPEHFAFIFPPLILWAYTAAFRSRNPWPPLLWGSLAWAGLVLTHNLSALLMVPVAVLHLLIMAITSRRQAAAITHEGAVSSSDWWGRRVLAVMGSLALAAGMSAAFWLPALAESRYVGLALGPSRGYENHLLAAPDLVHRALFYFQGAAERLGQIYPWSWLSVALLAAGLVLLLVRWWQRHLPANTPLIVFHLAVAGSALFMTTAAALLIWSPLTPILGHLQYPWRFLLLEAVGLMGVAAALPALLPRVRPGLLVAAVAVVAIAVAMVGLPIEPLALPDGETWAPDRMWREDASAGQVGATWTGEFLPLTVAEQRWALGRPADPSTVPAWSPPPSWPPRVTLTELSYAGLAAEVDSEGPLQLRLHQFHLPGWNATIAGRPAPTFASTDLGLVTVDVPAGSHAVELRFGTTAARTAGALISLAGVATWIGLAWWQARSSRSLLAASLVLALLAGALMLNGLGLGRRTWAPQPVQATLEDAAVLLAADSRTLPGQDTAEVTLYWLALRPLAENYKAFVHLLGPDGTVLAQHDGDPVGDFTPTTRWQPGEILRDRHTIPLPVDLPPGDYRLLAGLYSVDPLRNLSVSPPTADDRVDLGTLAID